MRTRNTRVAGALLGLVLVGACSHLPGPFRRGPRVAALADTAVCVVDRSDPRGLRTVAAKKDRESGRMYVLRGRSPRPFEKVYPADDAAAYARAAGWFRDGAPIVTRGRSYRKYGPERVIPARSLRAGPTFRGLRLFVDPRQEGVPSVLYVPLRPGCIFQPNLRDAGGAAPRS